MEQSKPASSRKRLSPDDEASSEDLGKCENEPTKRRCTSAGETALCKNLHPSIPQMRRPPTPPPSAAGTATLALKLIIPHEEMTREEERKLKRRRADAERWKPKLQRPYPRPTELNKAYPLKLMRHYPDTTARVEPDFVKPKIDKSPRLSYLLQQYPLMNTTEQHSGDLLEGVQNSTTPPVVAIPLSARVRELKEARTAHAELQQNIRATGSEDAQRLAWQSFSLPEQGRVDRGREAMIVSGLDTDDLVCEGNGVHNRLPDWRRPWTGRFAEGH